MYIMTAEGWKLLQRVCENRIYERQSWNAVTKEFENDPHGQLRLVRTVNDIPRSVPIFDERRYWKSVEVFCKQIQEAVRESQERRAGF